MPFSRWKLMAGVLGVSLGGLAVVAGQCSKADAPKTAHPGPAASSKVEAPAIPPCLRPAPARLFRPHRFRPPRRQWNYPRLPAPAKMPEVPASSPPMSRRFRSSRPVELYLRQLH